MKATTRWEKSKLVVIFEGKVSKTEFLYQHNKIHSDPRYEKVKIIFIDFSKADFSSLAVEDSYYPVAADYGKDILSTHYIMAFVATDEHTIRFIEYYIKHVLEYGVDWKIDIFPSQEDAENWIMAQQVAGGDATR